MIFYELTPVDTLFFRGSEPLEAGQLAVSGLFPPPVSVITGALRSEVLKQKNIPFSKYHSSDFSNQDIINLIGKASSESPFSVPAILLSYNNITYAPSPYSWFIDTDKVLKKGQDYAGEKIVKIFLDSKQEVEKLKITSSVPSLPLVNACSPVSLGGSWINTTLLGQKELVLAKDDILLPHELYGSESRTGISLLDDNGRSSRKVKQGALFNAGHIRLREGVSLIIALDKECGIENSGIMPLGGKQRLCMYERIKDVSLPQTESSLYLALAPLRAEPKTINSCVCSGKLQTIGGWDLAKGFHKDTLSLFPAGAVFSSNIDNKLVPIAF